MKRSKKLKRQKISKRISLILLFIGFISLLNLAGASDLNRIETTSLIIRSTISLLIMSLGALLFRFIEKYQ